MLELATPDNLFNMHFCSFPCLLPETTKIFFMMFSIKIGFHYGILKHLPYCCRVFLIKLSLQALPVLPFLVICYCQDVSIASPGILLAMSVVYILSLNFFHTFTSSSATSSSSTTFPLVLINTDIQNMLRDCSIRRQKETKKYLIITKLKLHSSCLVHIRLTITSNYLQKLMLVGPIVAEIYLSKTMNGPEGLSFSFY